MPRNVKLKYYGTAAALGVGWYVVLLAVPWMWFILIPPAMIPFNILFLVVASLIVARVFYRFITGANSTRDNLLRAILLPYVGCLVYLTLLLCFWLLTGQFFRSFDWQGVTDFYYMGFWFALGGAFVVIPYGLLCQYVMRRAAI